MVIVTIKFIPQNLLFSDTFDDTLFPHSQQMAPSMIMLSSFTTTMVLTSGLTVARSLRVSQPTTTVGTTWPSPGRVVLGTGECIRMAVRSSMVTKHSRKTRYHCYTLINRC